MLQLVRHVHLWMADIAMQEGLRELTAQVTVECCWHEALLSLDMHCYDKLLLACTLAPGYVPCLLVAGATARLALTLMRPRRL